MNQQRLQIDKSSRHQGIVGKFGEYLVCNWLSRSGFEVTLVDHTGIDVVAYDPKSGQRLGITVKTRTRNAGAEREHLTLFRTKKRDRDKVLAACSAFACDPWIAVYVETENYGDLFLLSLAHYDEAYRGAKAQMVNIWSMGAKKRAVYKVDPKLRHIRYEFSPTLWWAQEPLKGLAPPEEVLENEL